MVGSFRQNIAVIIGIEAYSFGIDRLSTPANDARRLAALLESDHQYTATLLTEDVTMARLSALFCEQLPQAISADDRLLVYFAGHGIALEAEDGPEGYLIPQDARLATPATYLAMTELYRWLAALPCRHLLLILDCCFAGAMRWSSTRHLRPPTHVLYRERFERFTSQPAWQIITSAAHDQRALDIISGATVDLRGDRLADGRQHSPFALTLFQALRGAADLIPAGKGDGVITATELYLYLRDSVEQQAADKMRHEQTPGLWSMPRYEQGKLRYYDRGEYIFLVPGHGALDLPAALPLRLEHNPYLGLHTYTAQFADLFFGRVELVARLRDQVVRQPFTVVLGPSGIGKSSLALAGLIPALQKEGGFHILPPLRPASAADRPFTYLAQLLADALGGPTDAAAPPAQIVGSWLQSHPELRLALVVDQLEELITVCRDLGEAEQFVALLDQLLNSHPDQFRLVLTLRNDFEPAFDRRWFVRRWSAGRFIVPPMSAEDLRRVIEEPAAARVLHFEPPELVDELMSEVIDSPGALPLLSFTLSELYRLYVTSQRDDRALTRAQYVDLGRVYGALRQRADEEYERLPDREHQQTMSRVMLRMVSIEGGELSRRRVFEAELRYPDPEENDRVTTVLDRLTKARLLVRDSTESGDATEPYVEPAHDALVRTWEHVGGGQRLSEDDLLLQRRLTQVANEWERAQAPRKARLLWNDNPRLPQLQDLLQPDRATGQGERPLTRRMRQTLWPAISATNPEPTWLNATETRFVLASILQRRNRWRQLIAWVMLSFTAITVAAMIAFLQRNEAVTQRNEAQKQEQAALHQLAISESQRLAQVAENLMTTRPEQSLLLAYEAGARNENALSNQALWGALDHMPVASMRYGDGVDQQVDSAELSPDGNYLLLVPVRGTPNANSAVLWDLANTRAISLTVAANTLYSARFSPDSQKIVTTDSDGWARVWDLQGQPIEAFAPFTVGVVLYRDAYFISNDQIFALDGNNGGYLLASGQADPVASFVGDPDWIWIWDVALSPDRQHLLTTGRDGIAILWDLAGQPLASFDPDGADRDTPHQQWKAAFSPDGQRVLTPAKDGAARLWDLSGREVLRFAGHSSPVLSAIFSPDGRQVLSASSDGMVRLWDLSGNELQSFSHDQAVQTVSFSPDGQSILTAAGRWLRLWSLDGRQLLAWQAHLQDIQAVSFGLAQDRRQVISVGGDRIARLWDLGAHPALLPATAQRFVFSPDRQRVFAADQEGSASLVSLSGEVTINFTHPISEAVFSADGRSLLTRASGEPVRLWTTSGEELATFDADSNTVTSMALSPDGQVIMTATGGAARLWRADGSLSATLEQPIGTITVVALDPLGQGALTAGDDGVPLLWDMQGQQIKELIGHTNSIIQASFSPDGQYIVTTARDGSARLWSREGARLQTFQFEGQNFFSSLYAQFSPASDRILVWHTPEQGTQQGQKAKVWGVDGRLITDLSGRAGLIAGATFSPSQPCVAPTSATGANPLAPYLLTTTTDGIAQLWSASGTELLSIAAQPQDANLTTPDLTDALLAQISVRGHVTQATFDQDACHILVLTDQGILTRSVYRMPDMLAQAACRVGRGLSAQEISDYGLVDSQRFDFSARHCPPDLRASP